jgi:hypothetical protein
MKNKKASWVQENVGLVILTILTVTILTFMVAKIWLNYQPDATSCQQSVALRASLPEIAKDATPLRCKTEKYCFVGQSGGSCKSTWGDAKDIAYIKVKDKLGIEKFISDKMVSCYNMMGQNKLSLFSMTNAQQLGGIFTEIYPTCLVCSRFAFDFNSLVKIDLATLNPMEYMSNYKMPDSQTSYLKYFLGTDGKIATEKDINFADISQKIESFKKEVQNSNLKESEKQDILSLATQAEISPSSQNFDIKKLNLDEIASQKELAIVFMQVTAPGDLEVVGNQLAVVTGLGTSGTGILTLAKPRAAFSLLKSNIGSLFNLARTSIGVGKFGLASTAGVVAAIVLAAYVEAQVISARSQQSLAAAYCGSFGTGKELRYGCSATKLIYYQEDSLKSICGVIESQ